MTRTMTTEQRKDDLFAGGGEAGSRMREIDWSATPLGPVSTWPESLKTCVRIILTSRQPMFVWWGDQLINLYNDPYKAIVGGKHPEALGQPAFVVWREIWDEVGPRAATAMRENVGTYDEALLLIMERHGYPEETYYTFSYSPVPNDRGGTGGLICANTDDTARIITERQLTLLRELAARTADARTWSEASARAASCIESNERDLPFALVYILDTDAHRMVLAGTAGISVGHPAAPETVELDGTGGWPFAEMAKSGQVQVVDGLAARFGSLPTGAWDVPPTLAAVVPIAASGKTGRSGALVVGLSPFRVFDDAYAGFLRLVAGQISASIANAQAYEEEKKRAEALAAIDRAKTAFFSNISHEFRTPITLMLGPTEDALASSSRSLDGVALETVHRNELRLLKLVNSLLDFSRIEAGRVHAAYRATDLAALTRDLASAFRSAVERGGLRFEVDCPPVDEPIYVDTSMWEKIVLNLLSNAFKFTFEGAVRVALRRAGEHIELVVSDTGVGISEHELGRVFERFHRIEGSRSRTHEGSGIGLALVRDLVELHGGNIRVDSRPGEGTTFTVSVRRGKSHIPVDRIVSGQTPSGAPSSADAFVAEALRWLPDSPAEASSFADTPSLGSASGVFILVADDNADMRDYVRRLLQPHWRVETTADGAEALAIARARRPDLVLTDVMMPNLDGFGLLRALREDPATARVPVVMLSARAGEESRIEGLHAGADDYLVKPFSAKELIARVSTHLELGRLRHAAALEQEKLFALFEHAPAPICVFMGPDHVFRLANKLYLGLIGAHREVVGLPIREALPELEGQGFYELLDRVYESGEPVAGRSSPMELARLDGGPVQRRYFDFVYEPYRDRSGQVEGIMVVASDVTDQVNARLHLDALRQAAEQANRSKDEFLAMLGHELRNPLAPIVTALHLMHLRDGTSVPKEVKVIDRQVKHLVRLVDDLLDVSRITRGRVELRKAPVDLADVVARGIEMAGPLLEQRKHQLDVDVSRGLIVAADADRLAQIVSNLVTNAAKYTDPGGRVTVTAERAQDEIVLEVADNGTGIPEALLPHLFEMFVQGRQDLDRSKGGLGLGLTIVKSLVSLHGGRVTARSDGPGRGSSFVVRLPASTSARPMAETTSKALPAATTTKPATSRVLVVDDNADAANALAEFVELLGCSVKVANDGAEALEAIEDFAPHVALVDLGLPVMDGYELARRLRMAVKSSMHLVAVTGYGQTKDRERSLAAGFDHHVVKPVDMQRLSALLVDLLGRESARAVS